MSVSKVLPGKGVLLSVVLAGLIGETLFEFYAWIISPLLFDVTLQPSNLVIALTAKIFGVEIGHGLAFPIHFVIGSLGFGVFVYLTGLLMPGRALLSGFVSGFVLWFVAQGMLAPFIGRSFMMDFGTYTQSSFVGHVGMTLIMAFLITAFLPYFSRNDDLRLAGAE